MEIDKILEKMLKNGSNKEKLLEVKKMVEKTTDNGFDICSCVDNIVEEIQEKSYDFLTSTTNDEVDNIRALSTCIYLPGLNSNIKIKLMSGLDNKGEFITDNTSFDIASITKLFTLLLTFKLEELQILDLHTKVADILPEYSGVEDFTIYDLLLLCGELYTNGNVASAKTKEEAEELLKTVYLKSNDRLNNKYTDFGAIIISKIIEKVINQEANKEMTYDQIMNELVIKPLGLVNTEFNPINKSIAGNGHLNTVHDRKTRILGGVTGAAGLFTTSDDLATLAQNMYVIDYVNYDKIKDIVSKDNLRRLGTITFPDSALSNRGLLGMYQKSNDPDRYFVDSVFPNHTFASQGWTGSLATFDPTNKIHTNILVDAINPNLPPELLKNDKPLGFKEAFRVYLENISKNAMTLFVLKQMLGEKMKYDIDVKLNLR